MAWVKGVTVKGKSWTRFNPARGAIALKDLPGTVVVTARY